MEGFPDFIKLLFRSPCVKVKEKQIFF
jgi:hypothetical protein